MVHYATIPIICKEKSTKCFSQKDGAAADATAMRAPLSPGDLLLPDAGYWVGLNFGFRPFADLNDRHYERTGSREKAIFGQARRSPPGAKVRSEF
jgi:hypothetical protein